MHDSMIDEKRLTQVSQGAPVMNSLSDVLASLQRDRFFGSVEIKFEAGRVVLLRKTETIKPDRRDTRGTNDEHDKRS